MTRTTPASLLAPLAAALAPGLKIFEDGLADLRGRADTFLKQLDEEIARKEAEQAELRRQSVPQTVFVDRVVREVLEAGKFAAEAARVADHAAGARRLSAHGPLRVTAAHTAAGPEYRDVQQTRLDVLSHDASALTLVGMMPQLFEPALRTWAAGLAADLPEEGDVETLLERHRVLQTEIEALNAQRSAALARMGQLAADRGMRAVIGEVLK